MCARVGRVVARTCSSHRGPLRTVLDTCKELLTPNQITKPVEITYLPSLPVGCTLISSIYLILKQEIRIIYSIIYMCILQYILGTEKNSILI